MKIYGDGEVKPVIILDTNIWISYLITKNHLLLDDLLINQQITILFSEELLNEFF